MIPIGKVNEAYDALNLPRDAPFQAVRDRIDALRSRLSSAHDSSRLSAVEEAFKIIETNEETRRAQREASGSHIRSKSERELDGTLEKLTSKTIAVAHDNKRPLTTVSEHDTKRLKEEVISELKTETEGDAQSQKKSDDIVFEKLAKLLKDESKYLRAVNVLHGIIKSLIDHGDTTGPKLENVIGTFEIAISSRGSTGSIPLANIHEDNRKAISKVLALIESSPDMLQMIHSRGYFWKMWQHAVRFRNSFYDLDNFKFTKRCKELVATLESLDVSSLDDEIERMLVEISVTVDVLCSPYVSKIIPGRFNEVRNTMTEIYKLTRMKDFPTQFKDNVAEHQRNIASS